MPLDPAIANPSAIQIQDPLEQYQKFQQINYLNSEIQKAKYQSNQNALVNKAFQSVPPLADGTTDFNGVARAVATAGGGTSVGQLSMDAAKTASDRAMAFQKTQEGLSNQADALGKTMTNVKQDLDNVELTDPVKGLQQYNKYAQKYYSTPAIVTSLRGQGIDPNTAYQQDMAKAQQSAFDPTTGAPNRSTWANHILGLKVGIGELLKQNSTQVNLGGSVATLTQNSYGGPVTMVANMPVSQTPAEQLQGKELQYATQQTGAQTNLFGLPKYEGQGVNPTVVSSAPMQLSPSQLNEPGKAMDIGMSNQFLAQHAALKNIPETTANLNGILSLLKAGPITGAGQSFVLDTKRAAAFVKMDPNATPDVTYTQELNKRLSAAVLSQMQNGNTGRMTNMMLTQMGASNPSGQMTPNAIRDLVLSKLADIRTQVQTHNDLANQLLHSPQFKDHMKGMRLGPVPMMGIPDDAVARLKANPTPTSAANFDEAFGKGSAADILNPGGTPTGADPLAQAGSDIPVNYNDTALLPVVQSHLNAGLKAFPGLQVTSQARSVARNADAGGADDSSHLHRVGFDLVPAPGQSWSAVRQFYESRGARVLGPGDPGGEAGHLHVDYRQLILRHPANGGN